METYNKTLKALQSIPMCFWQQIPRHEHIVFIQNTDYFAECVLPRDLLSETHCDRLCGAFFGNEDWALDFALYFVRMFL